jgi:hypothetical protein
MPKRKNDLAENVSRPLEIRLALTPPDDKPSGYTYKAR